MQILNFLFNILIVAVSVFGGGPVFIPAFKGILVGPIMSEARFDEITTIVNITPGALGSKYALIGGFDLGMNELGQSKVASFLIGLSAMGLFIFVALGMVLLAFKFVHNMNKKAWFSRAIEGSSPAVCGILAIIMLNFLGMKLDYDWKFQIGSLDVYIASLVIFGLSLPLLMKFKIKPLFVIIAVMCIAIISFKLGFTIS